MNLKDVLVGKMKEIAHVIMMEKGLLEEDLQFHIISKDMKINALVVKFLVFVVLIIENALLKSMKIII